MILFLQHVMIFFSDLPLFVHCFLDSQVSIYCSMLSLFTTCLSVFTCLINQVNTIVNVLFQKSEFHPRMGKRHFLHVRACMSASVCMRLNAMQTDTCKHEDTVNLTVFGCLSQKLRQIKPPRFIDFPLSLMTTNRNESRWLRYSKKMIYSFPALVVFPLNLSHRLKTTVYLGEYQISVFPSPLRLDVRKGTYENCIIVFSKF